MSMINEALYSNVRGIRDDLDLVADLKGVVEDYLRGSADKTEKVFHLYLKVQFHGFYIDQEGCFSEIREGGKFIINIEDNYKIMQVLDKWGNTNGGCLHKNPKKKLVVGDLDIKVYDYKNMNKIYITHYECRNLLGKKLA